ncbi:MULTISPECIES: Rossmann-like and DUF2520 domain-containing protein [Nocardiaceae]|uniref:Rossmann-like and DUF2520 domain-containing protein n=1 Tax=Nocardiaceae TaxID=85025 RepID=UPI00050C7962|nr:MULTISPECIES: DUF2520 domain-containing protein [Rhodococcus]OZC47028.1 DUF2520 domain-containing protein [Rhodococcus sp. WWJCD1]OZC84575.1 DUF2520 domain-containing protein [Rhodococcus sp. 06-412-2C]OZC98227.1 DUF2520 domain-containing protein [Rhodococcus sp. 06-412-2B]OZE80384.1 DUF2520 domain-containing protein [Rhodococcus sp. 15-649-2-2]
MTSSGFTGGLSPARLTVGVVSAGRVGTAFGEALERVGHVVVGAAAVSDASLARVRDRLPESQVLPVDDVARRAELLILAVPDSELASIVAGLAATGAVAPGKLVVHTSGANGVSVLEPLAALGAVPLAIHPAMTFSGRAEDTDRMTAACFGITASDEIGYAVAQALVLEIGGEPVHVAENNRALYHAALAHGSNHLVTLVVDAVEALRVALAGPGFPGSDAERGVPERVLAPLLEAALDNALRNGQSALTGPVARGDTAAVGKHLDVLGTVDPRIAAGYRALSLRSAQRIGARADLIELLEGKQ